jgi:glyceraldehyde-3-phosphate dehydrogenase (NADP+)
MKRENLIANIFPDLKNIPEKMKLSGRIDQRQYLVNGVMEQWDGPVQEVLSPVCLKKNRPPGHAGTENRPAVQAGIENSPAGQASIGSYPLLTEKEALQALDAAVKAYDNGRGKWPTMSVEQRITHMEQFVIRMMETKDEVVKILMWEIGKSLPDSEKEFDRTVEYIRDTIDALKDLDRNSSRLVIEEGIIGQIRRAPLGVVLCMGPYNYPLNETFTTVIPALIMGNTVIFKPPKLGVLLHQPLLRAFCDSFPAGVVNIVYGDGPAVIGPMMKSGRINSLAFIGSSTVADILKKQHPKPHRLRSVLGLEAKNPAIILADADPAQTAAEVVTGALSFNGQRCTALKLIFVHQKISETFLSKLAEEVEKLKTGMPWENGVRITPLPELRMVQYQLDLIKDAVRKGAKIINPSGGASNLTFIFPAVLFPVNENMRIFHEEQFGPVIPVVPYKNLKEPLEFIIRSDYGQQVSIFGKDESQIARLIDPLVNQVCRVNLNSQCQRGPDTFPFTGRKDSAEGTLSVSDALRVFTIRTLVAAKETDLNKTILKNIIRENKSTFLSTDYIL